MKKLKPLDCISAKVKHLTELDAQKAANLGIYRGAPKLFYYQCKDCSGWHLTSSKK